MPFRKIVFWIHLACGLTAGSVILLMSVTGVLLTYEKQMEEWADRRYWVASAAPGERAPVSELVQAARGHAPDVEVTGVTLYSNPAAPVGVSLRGGRLLYLDPSSAEVRGEANAAVRSFFSTVMGWHRWFNISGQGRAGARAITGWANVVFLFLVLSGLYLWFPRRWRWQHFRSVLLFNLRAKGKARDFNWHHVFGFWMALPLALVVASATVISFPWASDLAYRVMGDEPPRRRAGRPAPERAAPTLPSTHDGVGAVGPSGAALLASPVPEPAVPRVAGTTPFDIRTLDALVGPATRRIDGWRVLTFTVPAERGEPVRARVDQGWGGQPQKRHTLTYDATTGHEISYEGFRDQTRGARLRSYLRFAHTGEFHGLWGQTVAGLASLAGVLLVWTGFALAWRRLVAPLLGRKAA